MTSAVSSSESIINTWLPGTCGLPSAWRSRVNTMLILTNAVTISTAAGASEITANRAIDCAEFINEGGAVAGAGNSGSGSFTTTAGGARLAPIGRVAPRPAMPHTPATARRQGNENGS